MPTWFLLPLLLGVLMTLWGMLFPRMQWRWLGYWGAAPEEDPNPDSFYRNLRWINFAGLIALSLCLVFFFATASW